MGGPTILGLLAGLFMSDANAQANSTCGAACQDAAATERLDQIGFSITLNDETIAGAPRASVVQNAQASAPITAKIRLVHDGLDITPRLNVGTKGRASYLPGQDVIFRASTNYPAFLARAEIRVLERSAGPSRVVAELPVSPNGEVSWRMPSDGVDTYIYVLRVFDAAGRYNETAPLELRRVAKQDQIKTEDPTAITAEPKDRTRIANIPINGGNVSAYGTEIAPGTNVRVMKEDVQIGPDGTFVVQRILPPGEQLVDIAVSGADRRSRHEVREIEIPENDWFLVGIADLTLNGTIEDQLQKASGEDDAFDANGRVGLYFKGRIKGEYLITASVDSGDGAITDIFDRIDDKDPRWILEQLDPNDFYPVYGDDSSAIDDTPSTRRFYVRVERQDSFALWGDYNANFNETEYLQNNRELYGARARFVSPDTAENGESRLTLDLYAANPETLAQRDILQGTGGSAYFLSRQAIRAASETLYVEVREQETDRVIERQALVAGQDYDIDYLQGVVILREPLASTAVSNSVVRDAVLGENQLFLIAQYEFTPAFEDVDGVSLGGRVEFQPTERLRLGVTAMRETTGLADQQMLGADLELQIGENSTLEAEIARSEGPGFTQTLSRNGGLIIDDDVSAGTVDVAAFALRFSGLFDLQDLGIDRDGELGFYYEYEEGGFSSFTENISDDQTLFGGFGRVVLTDDVVLTFAGERFENDDGEELTEAHIDLSYRLAEDLRLEGGVAYESEDVPGRAGETGERTDLGLRVTWEPIEDLSLRAFGQVTALRLGDITDNDRIGIGMEYQLTEKLSLGAEISGGDQGLGALAKIAYHPTPDDEIYLGYTLDPTATGFGDSRNFGTGNNQLVFGERHRLNERLTTYGENTYDLFGNNRSLTSIYGVDYSPSAQWSLTGALEVGEVSDDINGDFNRQAVSLGMTYANENVSLGNARLEFRREDGETVGQDRMTYAFSGGYEFGAYDDWRFLTGVDLLISDSDDGSFRDGDYVEASVGYAYRPVENDRTNALFRYTYLRDLPGVDQVTVNGSTAGLQQESHILSADVIHDLNDTFTVGAKYGYRRSMLSERDGTDTFGSNAHLGVLRVDWHVVDNWDLIAEARLLYTEQGNTAETGLVFEVDRHIGENLRLGIGYEFGGVSSDIGDVNYRSQGVFLNFTAKF